MESISDYSTIWANKPVLRIIYGDLYQRMLALRVAGPGLEIGGGVAGVKTIAPDIISSDIQYASWLDLVADAQDLPFRAGSLSTIFLVDVLHHVEFPIRFLRSAAKVLRPGGRIIMVEPAITPGSSMFYRYLHREPVRMQDDPLVDGVPAADRDPYASNQAIPTLLATRDRQRLETMCPEFGLVAADWFSFLAYPLSGGFQPWSLLPASIAEPMLAAEKKLERAFGRILGFRLLFALERREG